MREKYRFKSLPTAFSFLRLHVAVGMCSRFGVELRIVHELIDRPHNFLAMLHFHSPSTSSNNCWTGTSGQGTLGALSIELLARRNGPGGNRTHNLPLLRRSNPVLHHVQLRWMHTSFPRINPLSVAFPKGTSLSPGANRRLARDSRRPNLAGRNSRSEQRSHRSASFDRRSNSSPRHPGIFFRRESAARV